MNALYFLDKTILNIPSVSETNQFLSTMERTIIP
jgi:hypothetical protein